jgi:hypothetical protein
VKLGLAGFAWSAQNTKGRNHAHARRPVTYDDDSSGVLTSDQFRTRGVSREREKPSRRCRGGCSNCILSVTFTQLEV